MNIKEQREAIYLAETEIEASLDKLRETSKLIANKIHIQTIMDDDKNVFPVLKVNIEVSRLKDE